MKLGGFLAFAACGVLLLLMEVTPIWWALLVLAVPAYFFLGWFGGKVFADKYGWSTEQVGFSPLRIFVGVLLALAAAGVALLLWRLAARL